MSQSAFRATAPRPLSAIVPDVARPVLARATSATARLKADWPLIVGAALAEACAPLRLAGGTLTLACPGPAALALQHDAPMLIARIHAHLAGVRIDRLRLVQAPLPGATDQTPRPARARGPAATSPRILAALAGFPAGPVRDALARLGDALDSEAGCAFFSADPAVPLDAGLARRYTTS